MTCTPMKTQYGNATEALNGELTRVYQSCSGHDLPHTGTNVLFIIVVAALILFSGYMIRRATRRG